MANIQHPTSNIQHPTSNIQLKSKSGDQRPTSNIQHPTSNIQRPTSVSKPKRPAWPRSRSMRLEPAPWAVAATARARAAKARARAAKAKAVAKCTRSGRVAFGLALGHIRRGAKRVPIRPKSDRGARGDHVAVALARPLGKAAGGGDGLGQREHAEGRVGSADPRPIRCRDQRSAGGDGPLCCVGARAPRRAP